MRLILTHFFEVDLMEYAMSDYRKDWGKKERRSEPRMAAEMYAFVEIFFPQLMVAYQFKLRNLSSKGLCIVIKQGSEILKHLKESHIYELKFCKGEREDTGIYLKTKVKHITKGTDTWFKGHFLVGLIII